MGIHRVAVVVPGIMGSSLVYRDAAGNPEEIWGENFYQNYRRLLSNPTMLRWNDIPAEATLLENVYVSNISPWPKYKFWQKLLEYLYNHAEFQKNKRMLKFAYDWRQSLLETAEELGSFLQTHIQDLQNTEGVKPGECSFVFLTHSMGGLVVRIALALGEVEPQNIDRIIHIGSPLEGAPSAFRSAYGSRLLPMLAELTKVFHWKNADRFFEHLLDNIRTFPSIYQLMPPKRYPYLYYSPSKRSNPLNEQIIRPKFKILADDAHDKLEEAERVIIRNGVETFTIYTESHNQEKTDVEFRVQPLPSGYKIEEVLGQTYWGDGSVPFESARGNRVSCKQNPILNVTHAFMCNDTKVVSLLPGIIQ